jgi:hypothetical protein
MFEQTSRLAEKVAASVSRRRFLGSLGGWAGATAMAVAGLAALPRESFGGTTHYYSCLYQSSLCTAGCILVKNCNRCPSTNKGCRLTGCIRWDGRFC